ncbi:type II toxin-antitoxin system MqsA family antitoxin [Rhodoferax mekongensis]|uniref:type II toxin-antitoxin system MqsA family antitoxin n=1 Tax=Rhodoferax mekongensis TaxID=3068341 RepID=UPI0028BE3D9F|nr:type II toxin-antitoxin system MqsA family antitoxin [Rhodoferax sp. TBRC 17199]MDT7517083.1 type II toxin-antitoxin system MqsA family antitoxin [Rhodoferax sp. TBRC 17199]
MRRGGRSTGPAKSCRRCQCVERTAKKLKLTQDEASRLTGGGNNAFLRYETGVSTPWPEVFNLFNLLDKHPEMWKQRDCAGELVK